MQGQLSQVAEFHQAIGEKVAAETELLGTDNDADQQLACELRELMERTRVRQPQGSHLARRALMAVEELAEWIEAHVAGDLVEAADAVGDRLYVLLGDAVATGLPIEEVFEEVHRSNLTKAWRADQTGKGKKNIDFSPPKLGKLIRTELKEEK